MKKVFFLAVVSILATEFLFAQYPQGQHGHMAEGVATTLPKVPEVEIFTDDISGKVTGSTIADSPDPNILTEENSVYHLEFTAENGITLLGATAADLLHFTPCLTDNFAAFMELTQSYRIQVFVNGEPMVNRTTTIKAALRQIPAESIKAIDIRPGSSDESDPADLADFLIQITKIKSIQK